MLAARIATEEERGEKALALAGRSVMTPILSDGCAGASRTSSGEKRRMNIMRSMCNHGGVALGSVAPTSGARMASPAA